MEKYTTDLFFAAFLKLKGYELGDFQVIGRGKGKYKFNISDEDMKKLKLEFSQSDISKIKQIIETLKDMVW